MNKKLIMIFTLMAAASMTFAACGKKDSAENAETSAEETVSESVSVSEETEEDILVEEDDEAIEEILDEAGDGLTDDDTLIDDDSADIEETAEDVVDEYAENPLSPVIDKVLSESEWPALSIVTDETILKEFFLLDPADYKEMIVMQCPISAKMSEIIIVNSDDISAAEEALNARRQKAIDQDAWYPNDVELAQNSIVGTNGSYAYFIIGDNAEAAEASINSYFDAL